MKKIIVLAILTILLLSTFVAAATEIETNIANVAMQNENVVRANCIVYRRYCLIALQTRKFTSREEYESYVENLADKVKSDYEIDKVIVTRSPKALKAIDALNDFDDETKQKYIEKLLTEELKKYENKYDFVPYDLKSTFAKNRISK